MSGSSGHVQFINDDGDLRRLAANPSLGAWLAAAGPTANVLAELLGQSDDDPLRAAHEAEPVDVLVLRDLADEFGTVAA